jgi:GNAT superfamily N-acetyltransferase
MAAPNQGGIETLVTYLEMTAPPPGAPLRPPAGIEVRHAVRPTIGFYRYLYDAIGAQWTWCDRKLLDDRELAAIIHDPSVEVNVLWAAGVPAGLAELDGRAPPDVELAYFGLLPEFIGQGLGRFLLDWAVQHAWRGRLRRFWVHTCDLDHPRALGVYQKAGFRIYDRRMDIARLP